MVVEKKRIVTSLRTTIVIDVVSANSPLAPTNLSRAGARIGIWMAPAFGLLFLVRFGEVSKSLEIIFMWLCLSRTGAVLATVFKQYFRLVHPTPDDIPPFSC